MNAKLTALLLALTVLPAAASDLVSFPDGKPQDLNNLKAPVRIINFWGSYCKPCVKEMPEMSAWYKKENLPPFLKTTPVSYPIWHYAGKDNRSFMKNLGNSVGALPFTTVEAVKCGKKEAILGGVDSKKLDAAVQKVRAECK